LKLAADCIVEGIQRALEEKNFRLGHKTAIEEYLNETEAAEQQKKEKLRQKRQKRKEKKKGKKPNEEVPSPTNSSKANLDEEDLENINETKDTKSTNKHEKHHGQPLSQENKPPNEESKDQKKQPKNKNLLNSPIFDKASTNSNTPESRTSFEKNMTHLSDQKKPQETKPVAKKVNKNFKNSQNQDHQETISDERERNLLLAMGWNEESLEAEVVVDEKDVNSLKQKWKEIETSRANFRKNAKEKFMNLMSSK